MYHSIHYLMMFIILRHQDHTLQVDAHLVVVDVHLVEEVALPVEVEVLGKKIYFTMASRRTM